VEFDDRLERVRQYYDIREEHMSAYTYQKQTIKAIPKDTVRQGSKGTAVKLLQTELNGGGFACGTVDGAFGAKTLSAVKSFQSACCLVADGIVGQKTWTALLTVHTVTVDPMSLKAAQITKTGPQIKALGYTNFTNGNNFAPPNTIGWLISEGKVLREKKNIWSGETPTGTLLVYKDGTVKVGQFYDKHIVPDVDKLHFACQHWYVPPSGDTAASIASEGWCASEVGRVCNRTLIGVKDGKIVFATRQGSGHKQAQRTAYEFLGLEGAVALDAGGSCNLCVDNTMLFSTTRVLNNIIYW